MELVLFLLVLILVATWVSAPLRRDAAGAAGGADPSVRLERDARLAAVRDAELDAQMGKLSEREHRELDAQLRGEAIAAMAREEQQR